MLNLIHVDPRDVAQIIRATFPSYNGKKVSIEARETVTLSDLNWSGGTRSQYRTCTLDGQPIGGADKFNFMAPWDNPAEGAEMPVPAGFAVVQHILFCGKDLGLRITVNPADMPRMLPTPADGELSATEKTVLAIVRSLISKARRDEARRNGISIATYDETLAALKAKGLLTPQGGLTLAGKNAAQGLRLS